MINREQTENYFRQSQKYFTESYKIFLSPVPMAFNSLYWFTSPKSSNTILLGWVCCWVLDSTFLFAVFLFISTNQNSVFSHVTSNWPIRAEYWVSWPITAQYSHPWWELGTVRCYHRRSQPTTEQHQPVQPVLLPLTHCLTTSLGLYCLKKAKIPQKYNFFILIQVLF